MVILSAVALPAVDPARTRRTDELTTAVRCYGGVAGTLREGRRRDRWSNTRR
jgi:hypothetical protein